MRCNPWRWLWGLLPLAIVWWIGVLSEHEGIEADLKRRTQAALAANKAIWTISSFSGRDAVLTGAAADDQERQDAAGVASQVWGVRVVDNRASVSERTASYFWSAARGEKGVELAGYVPSEATREVVLAAVRAAFPGQSIDDRTRTARGVDNPDRWLSGVRFALAQLSQIKAGHVDLVDGGLAVEGEATTTATYRTVKSALAGGLPAGVALRSDKVTPPPVKPYTWTAIQKDGKLELGGYAPSERQRDLLLALAISAMPRMELNDRMQIASGEPRGWQGVTNTMMPYLARMIEGRADLADQELRVTGTVDQSAKAEQIRSGLANELPSGIKLTNAITVDPQVAAAEAKRAAEADASRQRAAAEEAQRQRAAAEEAQRQRAAAENAERQKAAAAEAERQKTAAADAARQAVLAEEAKSKAAEPVRQPEVRAAVDRCQGLLNTAVKKGTINFKRASSDIIAASHATLNELAKIAAECPKFEIDIVGHTDSEGTPERNQRLSERRAAAVAGYLAEAGVEDARLHAFGYGESQPIAPNDTPENRAKNRRIEFIVRDN